MEYERREVKMALNLYIDYSDLNGVDYVKFNDDFFDISKDTMKIDPVVKKLLYDIDKSKYVSKTTVLTRFDEYLDMEYSSTGCKTAINIYLNPDKIIDCIECGANALEVILKFKHGNCIGHYPPALGTQGKIDVNLHYHGKTKHYSELEKLLDDWYELGR